MTISIKKEINGITKISLNRPDVHNVFNEEMIADLTVAFEDINNCATTRVVILSGNGKSFSAGADLTWMKRAAEYTYEENIADAQKLSYMLNTLFNLKQLTIASVHGATMGGGLGLAACSDMVIAEEASQFSFSEVKLGLIPATISPFVIEAIGNRNAKRLFQTGEIFDCGYAYRMGLVSEIAKDTADRNEITGGIIRQVLRNAPQAMKDAKQLVRDYGGRVIDDELRINSAQCIAKTRAKKEAAEGLRAFFEKRKPGWVKDV